MAINFAHLDIDKLEHVLAIANTPNYLYRHLRENVGIDLLAKDTSVAELFEFIQSFMEVEEATFKMEAVAYAALIALTYKPVSEVDAWIEQHGIPPMRWATHILAEHKVSYIGTKVSELILR